jgi:hypothetical protein
MFRQEKLGLQFLGLVGFYAKVFVFLCRLGFLVFLGGVSFFKCVAYFFEAFA